MLRARCWSVWVSLGSLRVTEVRCVRVPGLAVAHPGLAYFRPTALMERLFVKQELFIEGNFVFGEKLNEFIFGCGLLMVFLLVIDIAFRDWTYGFTDGEDSVTTLPREVLVMGAFSFDPVGAMRFQYFHCFGY